MDVNKTIKTNKLIKELTKHGVVANVQDAFSKAESLVGKNPKGEKSAVQQKSDVLKPQVDEIAKIEARFRNLVKDFGQSVAKDLEEMRKEMFQLGKEINNLRNELVMLKARPAPKRRKKLQKNQQVLDKAKSDKPKGDYDPGGKKVSVGNVFYCGEK